MSRRASFFARTHPGQRRVRFPDEIVFHESIKESDGDAVIRMLRRVSVDIDINRINMSGMTAIHQVIISKIRNQTLSADRFLSLSSRVVFMTENVVGRMASHLSITTYLLKG